LSSYRQIYDGFIKLESAIAFRINRIVFINNEVRPFRKNKDPDIH